MYYRTCSNQILPIVAFHFLNARINFGTCVFFSLSNSILGGGVGCSRVLFTKNSPERLRRCITPESNSLTSERYIGYTAIPARFLEHFGEKKNFLATLVQGSSTAAGRQLWCGRLRHIRAQPAVRHGHRAARRWLVRGTARLGRGGRGGADALFFDGGH